MRNFIIWSFWFVVAIAVVKLALAVAGTDWSIPFALAGIVFTLVILRRSA